MPWINLTVRRGTFTKEKQHAVMAKLIFPRQPDGRSLPEPLVVSIDLDEFVLF